MLNSVECNLSDGAKKNIRDIAVPVLVAGLSTLLEEFSKFMIERLKEKMKCKKKEETKEPSKEEVKV